MLCSADLFPFVFVELRSVATDLGCSLILANTDPNVLLQMEQFRLPLVNLEVEEKKLKKSTSLLVAKTLEQAFFGKKGGRLGRIGISPSRSIFCNFFHPLNTCSGRICQLLWEALEFVEEAFLKKYQPAPGHCRGHKHSGIKHYGGIWAASRLLQIFWLFVNVCNMM